MRYGVNLAKSPEASALCGDPAGTPDRRFLTRRTNALTNVIGGELTAAHQAFSDLLNRRTIRLRLLGIRTTGGHYAASRGSKLSAAGRFNTDIASANNSSASSRRILAVSGFASCALFSASPALSERNRTNSIFIMVFNPILLNN